MPETPYTFCGRHERQQRGLQRAVHVSLEVRDCRRWVRNGDGRDVRGRARWRTAVFGSYEPRIPPPFDLAAPPSSHWGAPIGVGLAIDRLAFEIMQLMVVRLGAVAGAAMQIVTALITVPYVVGSGIAQAGMTLVAQEYGR